MEQRTLNLKGLASECREFLALLGINENLVFECNKQSWRRTIQSRVKEKNKTDILEQIKRYKKLDFFQLRDEPFVIKPFFKTMNLKDCRTQFSLSTMTTRTIKTHFMSDKVFASQLWECESCKLRDTIFHIKMCPNYEHLREANNYLQSDLNIVHYFQQVIKHRNDEIEKTRNECS